MKILFKNSIKELHISKNNPTLNTLSMQNKKTNKIPKRYIAKVGHKNSKKNRHPHCFKNSQKFINVSNKGCYERTKRC